MFKKINQIFSNIKMYFKLWIFCYFNKEVKKQDDTIKV